MEKLEQALLDKKQAEPTFNGTPSAAAKLMHDVGHQQLHNLLIGRTPPWRVRVHTKNEVLRVLGKYGIKESDFEMPHR